MTDLHLNYQLKFIDVATLKQSICFDSVQVTSTALSHRVPSYAYIFTELNIEKKLNVNKLKEDQIPQGPIWGKIQNKESVQLNDGTKINPENYFLIARKTRKVVICGDNDSLI
ncbi:hypothetical protein [Aliikangiella sp. IMCC44359]|uniref:hypothetical protein n=1 Tax=Aliikangiella sp. IMCC44359 TaxID=3459125 RepID=UPI00403B0E45